MLDQYQAQLVEKQAQKEWNDADVYRVTEHDKNSDGTEKPKFYACSMLPYPSGKLHMGHVRNYTINDMLTRQLRMKGYNVLMPMGWDAFGMPAENAAIKSKVPPAEWTYANIDYMKKQLQAMGFAIDWSREFAACDPEYYKWNQWMFLKMLEKGIAYRKTQTVNWDPVDQTVLANEQVVDGRGWRSGALIEKREIPGYYLKITDYAQELLDYVQNGLEGWPERVKLMQINWLGKSEGLRFAFPHEIKDADGKLIQDGKLYVFTTRPDTIMGVTFCAVAPEHPIATLAASRDPKIASFIEEAKLGGTTEAEMATKEKSGIPTGLFVTHPVTQEKIEIWVGNYVLMSYGDGAVMGVPAHDERDFAFALKYSIPIKQVISVKGEEFSNTEWKDWYSDKSRGVCINSGLLDGLNFKDAFRKIEVFMNELGLGSRQETWRLRDWGISRQRYWGTPIPIIHCHHCGTVPVPYQDLPVVLPTDLIPDGSGNPLNKCDEFMKCKCPKCGSDAKRETDTMDTFVDSSWYYMRYASHHNDQAMVDSRTDYWMPMDQYIGGIEHAVMHLLYARFWSKVSRDLGLVKFDEPFKNLLTQGMVLNHIYSRKNERGGIDYFWPDKVENVYGDKGQIVGATSLEDGQPVDYMGIGTMSKSKNNGVDPQYLIDTMGADTARLFVMFASPPEQTLEWSNTGLDGSNRFLRRLWNLCYSLKDEIIPDGERFDFSNAPKDIKQFRLSVYQILNQADYDYGRMQYNTVVSANMKLLNLLEDAKFDESEYKKPALSEAISILLRLLYPAVPHITYVLWQDLGFAKSYGEILDASWPQVDQKALVADEIEMVLQINGKLRGQITVPNGSSKEQIEQLALQHPQIERHLEGRTPKKIIVVPNKLVNVVG
ncbi:leucine--tRNA ligase [Taylorella equigenitalis]|uniref:leucine--tRNA ligase n=1 Tax=Taylorella equigenitalis TaxID=29575 RepID=UPI00051D1870|nr:leucine--tRNA ligase [Taylorella equigenitalis]ASY42992.1 leucine--tRNA ligase [Taylorella equigenitalis]KGK33195.1 leucine--tRNA ligase [Taylorella equigenitalis]WDU50130.1 leucine--tRNA ligase [Taylorella equigenitalis]WEE01149.1 leucine--tRNA ligase [Taylorella equigenitalis]WEE02626.1 leucine--tRNA ligase [Taylorella equigenitalis]